MKAYDSGKYYKLFLKASLSIAVAFLLCLFAIGCASDPELSLVRSDITLSVGDSRDILPYVIIRPLNAERSVSAVSDSDCLSVSGTTVTAVKQGTARVTVSANGRSAVLTVTIAERAVDFEINADGPLVRTVEHGQMPEITFRAENGREQGGPVRVSWSACGETQDSESFTFVPPEYGEFTVTAEAFGKRREKNVAVYRPTQVTGEFLGKLEQNGDRSAVVFTAKEKYDSRNPSSVYVWSVNGVERGYGAIFEFIPDEAGEYSVTLEANGRAAEITGKDRITITAIGERAPKCKLVFSDSDNGIYAEWKDGKHIEFVSVCAPDGTRVTAECSDARYAHLFGPGRVRITQFIDPYSDSRGVYKIILGAEGRSEIEFTQLPACAAQYANNKIMNRNGLLSDAADAALWVRELYACGIDRAEGYIVSDTETVKDAIVTAAAELGLSVEVTYENGIVSVDLGNFVSAPTHYETSDNSTVYTELPHIEYSADARRQSGYVFSSDRNRGTLDVSGSEQLLYAVENGFKPMPEKGSSAERIYRAAKNVLMGIIGADHDEIRKIHAIYDWLQWAFVKSYETEAGLCSDYLEGVFGSAEIQRPDVHNSVATSLGAAKAFSLLCGTEGIYCRVVKCEKNGETYYINRVLLNGLLYNTDVFGGKISGTEIGYSNGAELTSHRGLLFCDEAAADLGIEIDQSYGEAFCVDAYEYLRKHTYNGEYFDNFIDRTELSDVSAVNSAVFYAFDQVRIGDVSIILVGSKLLISNCTLGMEFMLTEGLSSNEVGIVTDNIKRAVINYYKQRFGSDPSAVIINIAGNNVHVRITVPGEV